MSLLFGNNEIINLYIATQLICVGFEKRQGKRHIGCDRPIQPKTSNWGMRKRSSHKHLKFIPFLMSFVSKHNAAIFTV